MDTCYICNEHIKSSSLRSTKVKDGIEDREKIQERRQVYFKIREHLKNYDSLLPSYSIKHAIKNPNESNRVAEKAENPFKVMFEIEQLKKRKQDLMLQSTECEEMTAMLQEQRNQLSNRLEQNKKQEVMARCKDEIIRSLQGSLSQHVKHLLFLRIERALECFRAMKLEIKENPLAKQYTQHIHDVTENPQTTPKIRSWKLIGHCSISSIPLPNNGYFEHTPMDILCMGIFHIVHLLDALSMIFHIDLPHRVNVYETFHGPTITPQYQQYQSHLLFPMISYTTNTSSPTPTATPSLHWMTLDTLRQRQLKKERRLMHPKNQQQRGKGQKKTVDYQDNADNDGDDDDNTDEEYIMNPNFYQALLLLQANILVLCTRVFQSFHASSDSEQGNNEEASNEKVGVVNQQVIEPEHFFPPMAMLLNLKLLETFCVSIVQGKEEETTLPVSKEEDSTNKELFTPSLQTLFHAYTDNQDTLRDDILLTYTNHHYNQSRLARQVLTEYYAQQEALRDQQEHPEKLSDMTDQRKQTKEATKSEEKDDEVVKLLSARLARIGLVKGLEEDDGFVEVSYDGSSSRSSRSSNSSDEENEVEDGEQDGNLENVQEEEENDDDEEEKILWSSDDYGTDSILSLQAPHQQPHQQPATLQKEQQIYPKKKKLRTR